LIGKRNAGGGDLAMPSRGIIDTLTLAVFFEDTMNTLRLVGPWFNLSIVCAWVIRQ
jgi:hypothetical protein